MGVLVTACALRWTVRVFGAGGGGIKRLGRLPNLCGLAGFYTLAGIFKVKRICSVPIKRVSEFSS